MYGTLQEGADVIIAVIITACLFKETYETGSWSCSRGSERANEGCLFMLELPSASQPLASTFTMCKEWSGKKG